MLGHLLELIFRPGGERVDITVLVSHEVEIGQGNGYWLCSDAEETADIDDRGTAATCAVYMVYAANFVVISVIDCCSLKDGRSELGRPQSNVIGVIHFVFLHVGQTEPTRMKVVCSTRGRLSMLATASAAFSRGGRDSILRSSLHCFCESVRSD